MNDHDTNTTTTDTDTTMSQTTNTNDDTNSTPTGSRPQPAWELNDDAAARYDPEHITRKLPSEMTDQQQRHAIASIRNPDATWTTLASALDTHQNQVHGTIRSWVTGRLVGNLGGVTGAAEAAKVRPSAAKHATTFAELTPMQKAVVDAGARWYHHINKFRGDRQGMTFDMLAERIDTEYGVSPHSTYISDVLNQYEHLVERRRADEYAGESEDPGELHRSTPRILFSRAEEPGVPPVGLPDENLDNIPAATDDQLNRPPGEPTTADPVDPSASNGANGAADDASDAADEADGHPCPECGSTFPTKEKRDGHIGGAHEQPAADADADADADHDREFTVTDPVDTDDADVDEAEVDTVATLFGEDNRLDALDARVDDIGDRLEAVARLHDAVDEITAELAAVRERIEAMDTDDHSGAPYQTDAAPDMATAADTALHVLDDVNASDLSDARKRKAYKQAVEGLHRLVDAADGTPGSEGERQ